MTRSALPRFRLCLPALAVLLAACPPTMPPTAEVVIAGTVRAPDGAPAAGATVSVSVAFEGCGRRIDPYFQLPPSPGGRFEIRHPFPVRRDSTCFDFVAEDAGAGVRSDTVRVVLPTIGPEDGTMRVDVELTLRNTGEETR